MQLYLPESQAAYGGAGTVRAIVVDNNDDLSSSSIPPILDSQGRYAGQAVPTAQGSVNVGNVSDGRWHMLTLSTQPGGGSGFAMYLDGTLVGNVSAATRVMVNGVLMPVAGGDPILPQGNITLCDRADGNADRNFNGQLAQV